MWIFHPLAIQNWSLPLAFNAHTHECLITWRARTPCGARACCSCCCWSCLVAAACVSSNSSSLVLTFVCSVCRAACCCFISFISLSSRAIWAGRLGRAPLFTPSLLSWPAVSGPALPLLSPPPGFMDPNGAITDMCGAVCIGCGEGRWQVEVPVEQEAVVRIRIIGSEDCVGGRLQSGLL